MNRQQISELIESRGYVPVRMGKTDGVIPHPAIHRSKNQPKMEYLTSTFLQRLEAMPVIVLTKNVLQGKTPEERDVMILELMNS